MNGPSKWLVPIAGAAWCAVLIVCSILRPLQLDEVLQLIGTRTPHLASVFDWLHYSPGSVPIGYMLQWAIVRIAGFSNLVARLPSIAAAFLTVFAIARIGTRIRLRSSGVLALIVAVTPMLFRYSIEGRPYLPAFCLTAFATLLLLEFIDSPAAPPSLWRLGVYGLALASGPLVQGTAATVTIAHGLFVLTDRASRQYRSRQIAILAAIGVAALIPIAWSLGMRGAWAHSIAFNGYTFAFTFRTGAGFVKDLTGGGVACTGLLLTAAVYGYGRADIPQPAKRLLALTSLTAICGALASDALAGYFSSPRQAIYCLCGLIVLAVAGWERFQSGNPRLATLVLGAFAAASLEKDVIVLRSKEDWKIASQMLTQAAGSGFCIQPVSDVTSPLPLYSFFDPSLDARRCTASNDRVGLVYSIYTPPRDRDSAASALESRGFAAAGTTVSGGTTLEKFVKMQICEKTVANALLGQLGNRRVSCPPICSAIGMPGDRFLPNSVMQKHRSG